MGCCEAELNVRGTTARGASQHHRRTSLPPGKVIARGLDAEGTSKNLEESLIEQKDVSQTADEQFAMSKMISKAVTGIDEEPTTVEEKDEPKKKKLYFRKEYGGMFS